MDIDTAIGGYCDHFPSTQASLLEAATAGMEVEALDRVIAIYWKPIYRFIRLKFRKNNEDAKDLTQSFFAHALQRDFFKRFDPKKASFRAYIQMAAQRFAANQHAASKRKKRGGDIEFETVGEQEVATESPEQVFEREWQRQLFSLAIDDLRAHCERDNKEIQFRVFQSYDLVEGERPSYAELAQRYSISETSVTNYLAWARRILRQCVNERLRGTTSGERELRQEMQCIWT